MSVSPITGEGMVEFLFNQEMMAPAWIKAKTYRYVFTFSLISDIDQSITQGLIVE